MYSFIMSEKMIKMLATVAFRHYAVLVQGISVKMW